MRRYVSIAMAAMLVLLLAVPASATGHEDLPTLGERIVADADSVLDTRRGGYDIIGEIVLAILGATEAESVETSLGAALDPDAALTVFLPDDQAFRALAYDLTGQRIAREAGVIRALLDAVGGDLQFINEIVEYHVVPGIIDSAAALEADGVALSTVQGASFTVDVKNATFAKIMLVDNEPDVKNPFVDRRDLDNHASNGIWHGITRSSFPSTSRAVATSTVNQARRPTDPTRCSSHR